MSIQASWNTAMGAVAGALHFQDIRQRMGEAEERRIAREQKQTAGSNRPATVEKEMAQNNQMLMDRQATMNRIYQMSSEEAAAKARQAASDADRQPKNKLDRDEVHKMLAQIAENRKKVLMQYIGGEK